MLLFNPDLLPMHARRADITKVRLNNSSCRHIQPLPLASHYSRSRDREVGMALTDNCDVFASVSEDAFSKIVANLARQRPSLFNLGTSGFVANPGLMCHTVEIAPLLPANQPRVGMQQLLPVPGTGGAWGLEYCLQLQK